jgi:predicted permease
MLTELVSVVAPVFLVSLVGMLWVRAGLPFDQPTIGAIVLDLASPCLIFASLVTLDVPPEALARLAGATALAIACLGLFGAIALKLLRLPVAPFLGLVMFTNTGNMGIPVSNFAFGDEGTALAVTFFAVSFVIHSIFGVALVSGEMSMKPMLRSPLAWAALAAVIVLATGIEVPLVITRSMSLIGASAVPIMLLMLGASLNHLSVKRLGRALVLAVLRLGLGAAVGFGVAHLLGLTGAARGVLVLECSMPVAVLCYMIAARYEREPTDVAGATVVSTALSMITLPIVVHLVSR